jgi:hypothetical protein
MIEKARRTQGFVRAHLKEVLVQVVIHVHKVLDDIHDIQAEPRELAGILRNRLSHTKMCANQPTLYRHSKRIELSLIIQA